MILKWTKRHKERVGAIILAIDNQFRLNNCMISKLAQGTDPKFTRLQNSMECQHINEYTVLRLDHSALFERR